MSKVTVKEIFKAMDYGPAEESVDIVKKWLSSHKRRLGVFMNNEMTFPKGNLSFVAQSAGGQEDLATVILGKANHFQDALATAMNTFETWAALPGYDIAQHLHRLAQTLERHVPLMVALTSLESGRHQHSLRSKDIPLLLSNLFQAVGWAELTQYGLDTSKGWEPHGVVVVTSQTQSPVLVLGQRIACALATRNCIVVTPPKTACLSSFLFADICMEAGLPGGVFNVVVGAEIFPLYMADQNSAHGSKKYAEMLEIKTIRTNTRVEVDSKTAALILESADADSATDSILESLSHGQMGIDLYVQQSVLTPVQHMLERKIKAMRVGTNLDRNFDASYMAHSDSFQDMLQLLGKAREEGALIIQAGSLEDNSNYLPPTLVLNAQAASEIVQDDVCGPVMVLLPFRTVKEAVQLVNSGGRIYAGVSIWTEEIAPGLELSQMLKSKKVWLNCHPAQQSSMATKCLLLDYLQRSQFNKASSADSEKKIPAPECDPELVPTPELSNYSDRGQISSYPLVYGGALKSAESGSWRLVRNNHGEKVALVPHASRKDVRNAVEAAHKASSWSQQSSSVRAKALYSMADALRKESSFWTAMLTALACESKDDAEAEVTACVRCLYQIGSSIERSCSDSSPSRLPGVSVSIVEEAVGVVGIWPPSCPPLLSLVTPVALSLGGGNPTLLLPPPAHPHLALCFGKLALQLPLLTPGALGVVSGPTEELVRTVVEHRDVQALWCMEPEVLKGREADLEKVWMPKIPGLIKSENGHLEMRMHATKFKEVWVTFGDTFAN